MPGVVGVAAQILHSHTPGRPGHRRSYTKITTDEGIPFPANTRIRRGSKRHFHFGDDTNISGDEDDLPPALRLTPPTSYAFLSTCSTPSPPHPTRPRSASTPVHLSDGTLLKSSLKTSSSAPHISHTPRHHHRSRSVPSSASGARHSSSDSSPSSDSDSSDSPKSVHFPATDEGLESVLLFKQHARPVSLSLPLPPDSETETETETDTGREMRWAGGIGEATLAWGEGFPRPRVATRSPLGPGDENSGEGAWWYKLDAPGVPRTAEAETMVLLEGLSLVGASSSTSVSDAMPAYSDPQTPGEIALDGTLLARNAAFEKHVSVRFTLDSWHTTSEVAASWIGEGPAPAGTADANTEPDAEAPGPGWDRFVFRIPLTDYARGLGLASRELMLAARFASPWVAPGRVGPYIWCDSSFPEAPLGGTSPTGRPWVGVGSGDEWWDNNAGRDYRVGFRVVRVSETKTLPPTDIPAPVSDSPPCSPPLSVPTPSSPAQSTQAHPTSSSSFVVSTQRASPPPPPAHSLPHAYVRALTRLHLRNYAAPASESPPCPCSPPLSAPTPLHPASSTTQARPMSPSSFVARTQPESPEPPPAHSPPHAYVRALTRLHLRNYAAPVSESVSTPCKPPMITSKEDQQQKVLAGKVESRSAGPSLRIDITAVRVGGDEPASDTSISSLPHLEYGDTLTASPLGGV
ncbi:hypothetical protein B0H11DRAFT_2018184 [Mycena galericulata]|nr:hypothetical protein B0H11DRAFT_2018184 [Mycena galericulata]